MADMGGAAFFIIKEGIAYSMQVLE